MEKPDVHILVCMSFRGLEPKGKCFQKGAQDMLQYLEMEMADRGIVGLVSSTGCLKQCDEGPVMIVYPHNHWYGNVDSEEAVDEILDALEDGGACESRLLA